MLPSPPSTTITTMSMTAQNENWSLDSDDWYCATSAPATPVKKALRTNAMTLYLVVLMPIASAAISSSRTAKKARPWVEKRRP